MNNFQILGALALSSFASTVALADQPRNVTCSGSQVANTSSQADVRASASDSQVQYDADHNR
jgi:hypothetical protein